VSTTTTTTTMTTEPRKDRLRHSRSLSQLQEYRENNSEKGILAKEPSRAKISVEKNGSEPNRLAFSYEIARDEKVPPRPLYGPPSEEPKPKTNKCKS